MNIVHDYRTHWSHADTKLQVTGRHEHGPVRSGPSDYIMLALMCDNQSTMGTVRLIAIYIMRNAAAITQNCRIGDLSPTVCVCVCRRLANNPKINDDHSLLSLFISTEWSEIRLVWASFDAWPFSPFDIMKVSWNGVLSQQQMIALQTNWKFHVATRYFDWFRYAQIYF